MRLAGGKDHERAIWIDGERNLDLAQLLAGATQFEAKMRIPDPKAVGLGELKNLYLACCVIAEMTTREAGLDMRLHDLRHHYASSLISAGCSIVAVQRALGHAKASVTLDMYGHLMPSDEDRIRKAIDVAWEAAEDGLRTPNPMKAV